MFPSLRDLSLQYPIRFSVLLTLLRFALIQVSIMLAPWFGFRGWFIGLFANLTCTLFALSIVAAWHWWEEAGILSLNSWSAPWTILPVLLVAVSWAVPGLVNLEPGWAWWGLTLLLVGINEEVFNRGLMLYSLGQRYAPRIAAGIATTIFGLQHLSNLVTSRSSVEDVLWTCVLAGMWGFAVVAIRLRSHWLIPLICVHALEDFTQILSPGAAPVAWVLGAPLLLALYGYWLLQPGSVQPRSQHHGQQRREKEVGETVIS